MVTRKEFYAALSLIWLYITLVIGDLLRIEERWTTIVLFAASTMMLCVYAFISFQAVRPGTNKDAAPLSDRVKEIACDPDRKIEAIKVYREETGAGLADAKYAIEAYLERR